MVVLLAGILLLTETPEAHEDSHVDGSPLHRDGCGGVEAENRNINICSRSLNRVAS